MQDLSQQTVAMQKVISCKPDKQNPGEQQLVQVKNLRLVTQILT